MEEEIREVPGPKSYLETSHGMVRERFARISHAWDLLRGATPKQAEPLTAASLLRDGPAAHEAAIAADLDGYHDQHLLVLLAGDPTNARPSGERLRPDAFVVLPSSILDAFKSSAPHLEPLVRGLPYDRRVAVRDERGEWTLFRKLDGVWHEHAKPRGPSAEDIARAEEAERVAAEAAAEAELDRRKRAIARVKIHSTEILFDLARAAGLVDEDGNRRTEV